MDSPALAHYGPMAAEAAAELEPYTQALKRHDWNYEFAEGRAWRAGLEERKALLAMRAQLDPSGAIWNRFAPAGHRVPA